MLLFVKIIQKGALWLKQMDQGCRGRRPCLCLAATPTHLITLLFIPNNGGRGGGGSGCIWVPRSRFFFTGKVQAGTLKRASGYKRYSLSFLMEKNRKWRREAGLGDLYTLGQGRKEQVCLPVCTSGAQWNITFSAFSASVQHHSNTLAVISPGKQMRICLRKTFTF